MFIFVEGSLNLIRFSENMPNFFSRAVGPFTKSTPQTGRLRAPLMPFTWKIAWYYANFVTFTRTVSTSSRAGAQCYYLVQSCSMCSNVYKFVRSCSNLVIFFDFIRVCFNVLEFVQLKQVSLNKYVQICSNLLKFLLNLPFRFLEIASNFFNFV